MPHGLIAEQGTLTAWQGGALSQLSTLPKHEKRRPQKIWQTTHVRKKQIFWEMWGYQLRCWDVHAALFLRDSQDFGRQHLADSSRSWDRPESRHSPKRTKAAHAKIRNKPLLSEEETCGLAIRSCCFSYKMAYFFPFNEQKVTYKIRASPFNLEQHETLRWQCYENPHS